MNGYIKENNGNDHLPLVPTDENNDILTKYEELSDKIRYLLRLKNTDSDNYNDKIYENQI